MQVLCPNFEKRSGLIVVITQDINTGLILMQAYTDMAGYLETLRTGNAVYFSTSRQERWMKGEESGDVQKVKKVAIDCDGDAVIYFVEQKGTGACHTQAHTCFYRLVTGKELFKAPKAGEKEALALIEAEVHADLIASDKAEDRIATRKELANLIGGAIHARLEGTQLLGKNEPYHEFGDANCNHADVNFALMSGYDILDVLRHSGYTISKI